MRLLQQMMVTIGIANISDCCVYYLAGSSNIVIKVLVFLSGSWLLLGNVMIGYIWAKFIMVHMNIPFFRVVASLLDYREPSRHINVQIAAPWLPNWTSTEPLTAKRSKPPCHGS